MTSTSSRLTARLEKLERNRGDARVVPVLIPRDTADASVSALIRDAGARPHDLVVLIPLF